MDAARLITSFLAVLTFNFIISFAFAKLTETEYPMQGCPRVTKESFNFPPNRTSALGVYCAFVHNETLHNGKPTSGDHRWVGSLNKSNKKCLVCCARGNGSDKVHYSNTNGPKTLCKKKPKSPGVISKFCKCELQVQGNASFYSPCVTEEIPVTSLPC
uniref:Putative secreted protein n=1 Tax=Amblyomma triste TaxID=251400 RepID=A0A023G547_AMBTT